MVFSKLNPLLVMVLFGGDDWDERVIDWLADSFKGDHVSPKADPMALQRLKGLVSKPKDLSSKQTTQINLPFVTATDSGPLHLDYELSRAKFQEISGFVDRCRPPFQQAIDDANLTSPI